MNCKVKPLKWIDDFEDGAIVGSETTARFLIHYQIGEHRTPGAEGFYLYCTPKVNPTNYWTFATVGEAKAFAQKDYAKRIMALLEDSE